MWRQNPYCYYCGVKTIFTRNPTCKQPNMATIDHLRVRGDPDRLAPLAYQQERRRVLACRRCNVNRANPFIKQMTLEQLWIK